MKQINIFTAILFFSLNLINAQSSYIEIGENPYSVNASQTMQFLPTDFSQAKQQFLITNAELTNANLTNGSVITGIQWYVDTDNTDQTSTFDLYLDDDFTGSSLSSDATFASINPTLVADDIQDSGQFTGWHTATFTNSFTWDGTDNLVIQLCRTGGNQSGNDVIQLVNTNSNYYFVTGYNHSCTATSGFYSRTYRPYFRLIVSTSTLSTNTLELEEKIELFPNPSKDFIQVSGLKQTTNYSIYSILGTMIKKGEISNNSEIDIKNFVTGFYFLKFDNGNSIKFLKK